MPTFTEDYILDDSLDDRICITGVEVTLQSDILSPLHDLVVRADTLRIDGGLKLPGRRIHLVARILKCTSDAQIDVSGGTGQPDFTDQPSAINGRSPGASGADGQDGGDGQDAGQIKIYAHRIDGQINLRANGGAGGKAQDGGTGAHGPQGSNGVHDSNALWRADAGNGGQGGGGGKAGVPGKGGDGGKIQVAILAEINDEQILTEAKAGPPGAKGKPGSAANGGQPGSPANVVYYTYEGP